MSVCVLDSAHRTPMTEPEIESVLESLRQHGVAVIRHIDKWQGHYPVKVAAREAGIALRSSRSGLYPRWVALTLKAIDFHDDFGVVVLWSDRHHFCPTCPICNPPKPGLII